MPYLITPGVVGGDVHIHGAMQNVNLAFRFKHTHLQWKRQPWQSKTVSRTSATC